MGFFSSLFSNSEPQHEGVDFMFNVIEEGVAVLERYKPLSKQGKLEVYLFGSGIVMDAYQKKMPDQYNDFEEKYFKRLYNLAVKSGLSSDLFQSFCNSRFRLYQSERRKLLEGSGYTSMKIFCCFYQNPLSESISIQTPNPVEHLSFHTAFMSMWTDVAQDANLIN